MVALRLRVLINHQSQPRSRRTETVERILGRALRLAEEHPAWTLDDRNYTHTLTIGASNASAGVSDFLPTTTFLYQANLPGTASKQFAGAFHRWLDTMAARHHERVAAGAHELLREVEVLIHELSVALDENDQLRAQLQAAQIEIDLLKKQVEQLGSSLRTNRPSIAKAMLTAVGAVLLAVATGAAEGGASGVASKDESTTPSPAAVFIEQCDQLTVRFDEVDWLTDQWPDADVSIED